jgi:hypothetical protein
MAAFFSPEISEPVKIAISMKAQFDWSKLLFINIFVHFVTVGPTRHEDLAMSALKGYLLKECMSIRHCAIPYREWCTGRYREDI